MINSKYFLILFGVFIFNAGSLEAQICIGVLNNMFDYRRGQTCSSYVQCIGSEATNVLFCPHRLHFNEQRGFCDFPQFVPCDEFTTEILYTTSSDVTVNPTPTYPSHIIYDTCDENPYEIMYIAYPGDPHKFIECLYGSGYEMDCPQDFYFYEEEGICRASDDTTILPTTVTTTTSWPTTSDPQCNYGDIDFFPHPTDCSKYIECYFGESREMSCPDGLWFNAEEKVCVEPELSNCYMTTFPTTTTMEPACDDVPYGTIDYKRCSCGCSYYWRCNRSGYSQELQQCPEGLNFNDYRKFCAASVDCDDYTRTPLPWTTTDDYTGTSVTPTLPSYVDPRCAGNRGAFLSHPKNCYQFIECYNDDGFSYERSCLPGYYFRARDQRCVLPGEADCHSFLIQETDNN